MSTVFLQVHEFVETPRVAVLVTVHNGAAAILETLDSVAAQTLQPLELVVCNDGSTDNSAELASNWLQNHTERFARLALIANKAKAGLAASRNAAVSFAQAPFVFILDAGQILQPACLERSLEVLSELDENAAFVYSQQVVCDDTPRRSLQNLADWNPETFMNGNSIDAVALHRKAVLEDVGGFAPDPCFQQPGWEGFEVWFKYAAAGYYGIKLHQPLSQTRTALPQSASPQLWAELRQRYPQFFPVQS